MKIQVSKVFAKFMNETFKENGLNYRAEVVTMPENLYHFHVGNVWGAWYDYDHTTGKYKAIRVEYPVNFYACPLYLTTSRLNNQYERFNVKTLEDLKRMLREICEI